MSSKTAELSCKTAMYTAFYKKVHIHLFLVLDRGQKHTLSYVQQSFQSSNVMFWTEMCM